jgi:hypothetical protein
LFVTKRGTSSFSGTDEITTDRDPEDGRDDERRADGLVTGADPDRHDRLADGQDDEPGVPLGPVGGAVDPP